AAAVRDILDESEGKSMDPSALQQRLRRRLPDFSVRKLGFRRFADFLGSIIFSVWPGTQTSAFSDLKIA
ncbi:MAG: OST-HTH/LOTUS domain-containing protein, partial [Prevotella sp.]|nr:OST-HTH/LOTUS domain-containing protein [Prevotella sp.]